MADSASLRPEINRETEAPRSGDDSTPLYAETKLRPTPHPDVPERFGRECLPSAGLGRLEASWVRLPEEL